MNKPEFPRPPYVDWQRLAAADAEPWPATIVPDEHTVQPQSWADNDQRMANLYRSSVRQHYNLFDDVDWRQLDPAQFTPEQRIGLAYWYAIDSIFEQAGTTVFARAMIAAYELREEDATRRMLLSITRDEGNHDLIGKLVCERLIPGFPHAYQPQTPLEWAAMRNIAWAQESVNRFWKGYLGAYQKYRFQVLLSSFASGEAAGTQTYGWMARESTHPVFKQCMQYMAQDEARHLQLATYFIDRYMPLMTEDETRAVIRNLGGSYAYFSLFMAERPNPAFWSHLPASWKEWHDRLEDHARSGGLGIAPDRMKNEFWRKGLLRVKAGTDRHGVEFIAIPDLGIDGREEAISSDDVIIMGV